LQASLRGAGRFAHDVQSRNPRTGAQAGPVFHGVSLVRTAAGEYIAAT
jgi:hypothetical protein